MLRCSPGSKWILPDRPLTIEMVRGLEAGYLRGADLWHIATALYVAPQATEISFITLDGQQGEVASALGFQVGTEGPSVGAGSDDEKCLDPDVTSGQRS